MVKKSKTRKVKDVAEPEIIEGAEEIIEIAPAPKKKTTRRKKEVEFDIVEEK